MINFKINAISAEGDKHRVYYDVYEDGALVDMFSVTVSLQGVAVREYGRVIKFAVTNHYDALINGKAALEMLVNTIFSKDVIFEGYNKTIG